jgi:hypothetical protein
MLGAITVVSLLVALAISSLWPWSVERQMSAYSDQWNDVSMFREALVKDNYGVEDIMSSPTVLGTQKDWTGHLLIIMGVEKPYTQDELKAIRQFLTNGGKMILADDKGYSAPLLKDLPGGVSINRSRLYSSDYIKNPDFIQVTAYIDSGPVVNRPYELLTDRPAAFQGGIPGIVFSLTDDTAWLDANGNSKKDPDEKVGTYVLGFFYNNNAYLSDPSVFINDMWPRLQNSALGQDIVRAMLPRGGKVIFDESRHVSGNAAQRAQKEVYDAFIFVANDNYAKGTLIAVCIIGVLVYLRYVKLPTDWYHLPALDEPWLLNYKEGSLTASDGLRVRLLLENKVRVALRLSDKEFKLRRKAILEEVLDDPDLLWFLQTWAGYKKEDLPRILEKIRVLEVKELAEKEGGVA